MMSEEQAQKCYTGGRAASKINFNPGSTSQISMEFLCLFLRCQPVAASRNLRIFLRLQESLTYIHQVGPKAWLLEQRCLRLSVNGDNRKEPAQRIAGRQTFSYRIHFLFGGTWNRLSKKARAPTLQDLLSSWLLGKEKFEPTRIPHGLVALQPVAWITFRPAIFQYMVVLECCDHKMTCFVLAPQNPPGPGLAPLTTAFFAGSVSGLLLLKQLTTSDGRLFATCPGL